MLNEAGVDEVLGEAKRIELRRAVTAKDVGRIREICRENPWLVTDHEIYGAGYKSDQDAWIVCAVDTEDMRVVEAMVELGFGVSACDRAVAGVAESDNRSPLGVAVELQDRKIFGYLLEHGADPNLGDAVERVMENKDIDQVIADLALFLEHGLNLGWTYTIGGGEYTLVGGLRDAARDKRVKAF